MSQAGVIDNLHFARAALEQRGVLGPEQLPRLAKMHCSTHGLEYHLRGGKASNGKRCLRFSVRGSVQVLCQRCLDPLSVPIAIEGELASRRMDVGQLVEDEVILALPMVPRHETCVHHPVT